MSKRPRARVVLMRYLVLGLVLVAAPLEAQWLDPDTCWTCGDKIGHAVGGAALGLVVRGPWIAASWRDRWWKRGLWVTALGCVLYEAYHVYEDGKYRRLGQPGFGFGARDCVAVGVGWAASELILTTIPRWLGGGA